MILFCEYVVLPAHLDTFRAWAAARPALWQDAELMENVDQPGVFVEIRRAADAAGAAEAKKERLEGRPEWREMESWIKGGREGLRVWTFRPLRNG